MLRVLTLQPDEFCPPARLSGWLAAAGCDLDVVECFAAKPPTTLDGYDALVVLGGPMGANDDADYRWIPPAKRLLATAVAKDVPVFGVCLGAQLLAAACGGRAEPSAAGQQVGVVPIGTLPAATDDVLFAWLGSDPVGVHWNSDLVVALPPEAELLARSVAGVQAFRVGTRAWGVQFHPEADPAVVRHWAQMDVEHGRLAASLAAERVAEIQRRDGELALTAEELVTGFGLEVQRTASRPSRHRSPVAPRLTPLVSDQRTSGCVTTSINDVPHRHAPDAGAGVMTAARSYEVLLNLLTLGGDRRVRRSLARELVHARGDAVLDVGCGPGTLTLECAALVGADGRAVGIDASEQMVRRASTRAVKAHSAAKFRVANAAQLPFPDGSFDAVSCLLAVHHFPPEDHATAFGEMVRVVRPGGRLLVGDMRTPDRRWQRMLLAAEVKHSGAMGDGSALADALEAAGARQVRELKGDYPSWLGLVQATAPLRAA